MTWRTFLFDIPISILTVAIAAQLTTHYDLATDWRAALSAVAVGAGARLAPEALSVLEYYRQKTLNASKSSNGSPGA